MKPIRLEAGRNYFVRIAPSLAASETIDRPICIQARDAITPDRVYAGEEAADKGEYRRHVAS